LHLLNDFYLCKVFFNERDHAQIGMKLSVFDQNLVGDAEKIFQTRKEIETS